MTVDLDALSKLEQAATPGPWRVMRHGNSPLDDGTLCAQSRLDPVPRPYEPRWVGWEHPLHHFETFLRDEDADLIAAARNALPELLAELRLLRELKAACIERDDADFATIGKPSPTDAAELHARLDAAEDRYDAALSACRARKETP